MIERVNTIGDSIWGGDWKGSNCTKIELVYTRAYGRGGTDVMGHIGQPARDSIYCSWLGADLFLPAMIL